jgi:hypothetical protein
MAGGASSLRLWFEVDWPAIQLVGDRRLDVRAEPSDPLESYAEASGFWVELHNADGQALYRRVLYDPIGTSVEAPAGDGSWTRKVVEHPRGTFSLLVPDLLEARRLALFGNSPGELTVPSRELASFDLPGSP